MIPTPRTDAAEDAMVNGDYTPLLETSQQLEQELHWARVRIEELTAEAKDAKQLNISTGAGAPQGSIVGEPGLPLKERPGHSGPAPTNSYDVKKWRLIPSVIEHLRKNPKDADAWEVRELCERLINLDREDAELSDQLMRWFKAASPYATPGSLRGALGRLENAAPQVPHGVCRADDPNREADQRAGTLCSPPQAAAPTASAGARGVAPSVSDDSDGTRIPADAAPIDSTIKPSAWD